MKTDTYVFAVNEDFDTIYMGDDASNFKESDLPKGFSKLILDLRPFAVGLAALPNPKTSIESLPVTKMLLKDLTYVGAPQELLTAVESRRQFGLQKYYTELHTHNGRPVNVDIMQEALDLLVYLKQAELEGTPLDDLTLMTLRELQQRIPI